MECPTLIHPSYEMNTLLDYSLDGPNIKSSFGSENDDHQYYYSADPHHHPSFSTPKSQQHCHFISNVRSPTGSTTPMENSAHDQTAAVETELKGNGFASTNWNTSSCTKAPLPTSSHVISFENSNSPPWAGGGSAACHEQDYNGLNVVTMPKVEVGSDGNMLFSQDLYGLQEVKRPARQYATTRGPLRAQGHVIAERNRREKLNQRFNTLSAVVPGLKKVPSSNSLLVFKAKKKKKKSFKTFLFFFFWMRVWYINQISYNSYASLPLILINIIY